MVSKWVQLNPSYAKWHLDNQEIYMIPGSNKVDSDYDNHTLIHLMCCLGEPIYGQIIRPSHSMPNCWLVRFKIADLEMQYHVEPEHVTFLSKKPRQHNPYSNHLNQIERLYTELHLVSEKFDSAQSEVKRLRIKNVELEKTLNSVSEVLTSHNGGSNE